MTFKIFVHRFKKDEKGKKKDRKRLEFPEAAYNGTIQIKKKNNPVDVILTGAKTRLSVRMNWDSIGDLFVVAKKDRVRFVLPIKFMDKNLAGSSAVGQDYRTGKYTNWSAYFELI